MNDKGDVVGYVTSGTYSPIIKKGIGMGYTKSSIQKSGTEVFVV
jgi:aminomethyltransferase